MDEASEQQIDASERKLKKAIHDANEVLVSASTVFSLHPSTLTLNRTKLVLERHSGWKSASAMSVRIEDVQNVSGNVGPLFGSVQIMTKFTKPGEPEVIGLFHRQDALKLKRVIQGYIIALEKKVDIEPIPTEELKKLLYRLGEDDHRIQ
jgi:hypothetical protein